MLKSFTLAVFLLISSIVLILTAVLLESFGLEQMADISGTTGTLFLITGAISAIVAIARN